MPSESFSAPMNLTCNIGKYYLAPKNEEERKEKANRAREITLKHFTKKAVAPMFEAVINKIRN